MTALLGKLLIHKKINVKVGKLLLLYFSTFNLLTFNLKLNIMKINTKNFIQIGVSIAACLLFAVIVLAIIWSSIFVYVEPGEMGVLVKKTGKPLAQGQILAQPGQRGIQADVLAEGRHFIVPFLEEVEIQSCVHIKPGKIGVVTSKVGKKSNGNNIIVNDDEKGIWKRVLTPGLHRLNPYGYTVETRDAVVITPGFVGFVTALLGKPTTNRFAEAGQRGLKRDVLQPGIYYLNPYEFKIIAVEIGINQVTFAPPSNLNYARRTYTEADSLSENEADIQYEPKRRKRKSILPGWVKKSYSRKQAAEAEKLILANEQRQISQQGVEVQQIMKTEKDEQKKMPAAITFPSSDAFPISLDATIEWELMPKNVAQVMAEFGNVKAVEDKIIIPQSQSIGRLQGSTFKAKDFLLGESREKFQQVFRNFLFEVGKEKNIVVHSAFIRNIILPESLLEPIRERYVAVEKEVTANAWGKAKESAGELQRETSLIKQRTLEVQAEADALVKVIAAEKTRDKEKIAAETRRKVAEKQAEIAEIDAESTVILGEADADVLRWNGEAEGNGLKLEVNALGSPDAYTQYRLAKKLPKDMRISIVRTGDGTLWTDLEKTVGTAAAGKILKQKPAEKKLIK